MQVVGVAAASRRLHTHFLFLDCRGAAESKRAHCQGFCCRQCGGRLCRREGSRHRAGAALRWGWPLQQVLSQLGLHFGLCLPQHAPRRLGRAHFGFRQNLHLLPGLARSQPAVIERSEFERLSGLCQVSQCLALAMHSPLPGCTGVRALTI